MTTQRDMSAAGTWPEQNAVHAWAKKHDIDADNGMILELSTAVTEYRIELQNKIEHYRIAAMPQWRKDRYGWPIDTFEGKPFKSGVRIILQNIRKLTPNAGGKRHD